MARTDIRAEPGKQEIIITRIFDAPRNLVFNATIDPKLIIDWLGPRGYKMTIDEFEPKSGGSWRYVQTDTDGNKFGFHGVFHEITSPERAIQTFEFEGLPEKGHVSLETAKFEAMPDGKTKVIIKSVFQSVEDRDGMIQSGMEKGLNESHERLDELLMKLQAEKI
jgi:uncharacterized protein YndB with AHSA1/START domain